jgi:hypothetical protein
MFFLLSQGTVLFRPTRATVTAFGVRAVRGWRRSS